MADNKGGAGPVIAVIVIVIILAIGGFYYLTDEIARVRTQGTTTAVNI
jgi:hypothetical protein